MTWIAEEVHSVDIEFNPSGIYGKKRHRTWFNQETQKYKSSSAPSEKVRSAEIAEFFTALAGKAYQDWTDEVRVRIDVQSPVEKSVPMYRHGAPDLLDPDVDNTAKQVLDALNEIAWKDDKQVTQLTVKKHPRFIRKLAYMRIRITYIKNTYVK